GSPVGLEFYEHNVFPEKYRGAYFMADWSLGIIWVVFLERNGASYKGKVERFCQGAPLNVTDLGVGPDGAMYFTMGGRGSQGGVYRIVYGDTKVEPTKKWGPFIQPQPLAAWSRAVYEKEIGKQNKSLNETFAKIATEVAQGNKSVHARILALNALHNYVEGQPRADLLVKLTSDQGPDVRAHAVYLLGIKGYPEGGEALSKSGKEGDRLVQRRACEALIRAGVEPPVEAIWPLLSENDRFLRTAARLVLQRIDPKKWTDRLWKEEKDLVAWEG